MQSKLSLQHAINIRAMLAFVAAVIFVFSCPESLHAQVDGIVTHRVTRNTEVWRVSSPNVKKKILSFPQIKFRVGDQVRVSGGGCVQTGGSGKTWKRYVDPLGPNSDHLYHGMVLLPGAIGELPSDNLDDFARILIVKGANFTVKPVNDPQQLHLWLGYEDDNYDDNGYWGQDEGTQGQCKIGGGFLEHAFAIVTIIHPRLIHPVPVEPPKGQ